ILRATITRTPSPPARPGVPTRPATPPRTTRRRPGGSRVPTPRARSDGDARHPPRTPLPRSVRASPRTRTAPARTARARRNRAGRVALLALAACERPPEPEPAVREVPALADTVPAEESFAGMLAVTIDDLPWVGTLPPGESREQATRRLLDGLREHDAIATGFV